MIRISPRFFATLTVFVAPTIAHACLWDYDTLKQERARFPDTLEIITGKFLRHSTYFYEWRIQDRLKRIAAEPKNPSLYDDLAVAYEKTGQNPKAIETMLKVEEFAPGRYETYSNLGTFYFLGGEFKKGLEYVNKALAINPDAHFGREKYQKYLTEYVIERSKDGKIVLPLSLARRADEGGPGAFAQFLNEKEELVKQGEYLTKEQYQAAVKGVLGMMRFANHDSPVLLEVLGDLLVGKYAGINPPTDAKRLAARAYLQAAYQSSDADAKAAYRELANKALSMQTRNESTTDQLTLGELENEFRAEVDNATRWYAELRSRELDWIRDGVNPEVEFDKLYTEEPRVPGGIAENDTYPGGPTLLQSHPIAVLAIAACILVLVGILARVAVRFFRTSHSRASDANP